MVFVEGAAVFLFGLQTHHLLNVTVLLVFVVTSAYLGMTVSCQKQLHQHVWE
jgi:hypothetical protein